MHPLTAYRNSHTPRLTLRQVADEIGVKTNTVWRWENGRLPDRDYWSKIEAATGVKPEDLVRHVETAA